MPAYPARLTELRYFRFIHAIGGIANDGDRLCVAWRADLDPRQLPPALRPPALPNEGHSRVLGVAVFRSRAAGREFLDILDPDRPYDVTDRSVDGALLIEPLLATFDFALIDPPEDTPRCVMPRSPI